MCSATEGKARGLARSKSYRERSVYWWFLAQRAERTAKLWEGVNKALHEFTGCPDRTTTNRVSLDAIEFSRRFSGSSKAPGLLPYEGDVEAELIWWDTFSKVDTFKLDDVGRDALLDSLKVTALRIAVVYRIVAYELGLAVGLTSGGD